MKELEQLLENVIERLKKIRTPKGNVTESIFSGNRTIIPMADVQHIEKHWYGEEERTTNNYKGIIVITKHTTWSIEMDTWQNNIFLDREEGDKFLNAWCNYRHELENHTLIEMP